MEIQGKVIAVLPIKDGVGKTSGNEWKSREFVLETEESRPQSLCLQLMNANIDRYAVEAGQIDPRRYAAFRALCAEIG